MSTTAKKVAEVTNVNWRTVGSTAVGMALFGALIWGIRSLPSNAMTQPVKVAAAVATNTEVPAASGGIN